MLAIPLGRVLIVDDSKPLLANLRFVLELEGFDVSTAQGGVEGLKELAAHEFDAVLMDCRMPDIEGPEVCRRVRRSEGPSQDTPIIGMSIDGPGRWADRCRDAGMDDFIQKTGDIDRLVETLNTFIDHDDGDRNSGH